MLHLFSNTNGQLVSASGDVVSNEALWIDLVSPEPTEVARVEALLDIELPTRAEMEEIELSARLYTEAGAEFMTLTALARLDTEEPIKTPVTFILKNRSLVTLRYAEAKPFAAYSMRAQRPSAAPCASGEEIMLGIIEAMIDRTADALERVGNEIDGISHEIFGRNGKRNGHVKADKKTRDLQSLLDRIGDKTELLTMIQESLISVSRLVAYHAALDRRGQKVGKESRSVAKLIQRDASSLADHARALTARLNFMLDATLGMINLEQNQIIKIFSVASVAFLPPTLVASIYGMNFQMMPELNWEFGYPLAIGVMVMSAVVPYLYFKRRGWL
ncbi:magnesium/cobalt transporter CorA [Mesorhizobium sp. RP14(2022)]|uniref:Magnesium transport protein CorA n=1 Tax=Mesorhizobium liriopis TaxID=2953882 RepID=A0ABT1C936_9HYPH|nr:magnesium/cobalt transporter CorA [Mesorhizobium liriopis]MCO6051349.1 magnesium/cobalt transporter CorA [Mesorhizobium liriopis]